LPHVVRAPAGFDVDRWDLMQRRASRSAVSVVWFMVGEDAALHAPEKRIKMMCKENMMHIACEGMDEMAGSL